MSQYIHAFDSANKRVKPVNVDENGNLQVDIVSSSAGGDATAANQTTTHSKLDTIDTSINTIEACVSSNELAVSNAALTELAGALNASKLDVNISSDSASLATSANQTTTNSKLDTIDTSINTIEACVSSNELAVSNAALTELAGALNASKLDVNVSSDTTYYADGDAIAISDQGQLVMGRDNSNNAHPLHITANGDLEVEIADFVKGQATKENSFPVTLATNQPSIAVSNTALEPDFSQATLESATLITDGSSTSEIDMNGYNHLTIFGSSSVNFGSFCLARRATSGGSNFLDGSNMISASDPTGGSNYHFSATFENVGTRYVAFQNVAGSSQTVTLYAVKHR